VYSPFIYWIEAWLSDDPFKMEMSWEEEQEDS
jgi:hypothetical protein